MMPLKPLEWKDKKEIRVVYLGGSITQGASASRREKNWVSLVGDRLEEMFPDKTFRHFNSGVGGTDSGYGLLRVLPDVIDHRPDLLFIEFAVNDSYDLTGLRAAESILLSVRDAGLHPYICLVCTAYRDPNGQTAHEKYERLGERYGIPTIDLGKSLEREREAGRDTDRLFSDGCHPNDEGHAFYAKEIGDFLGTVFAAPVPVIDGELIDSRSHAVFARFRPVLHSADIRTTGTWVERDGILFTTGTGATLEGEFEGPVFGLVDYWNLNGGKYLLELDGEKIEINTCYDTSVYQPAIHYLSFDLAQGKHRFRVTSLGTKIDISGGCEVVISSIVTETAEAVLPKEG